MTSDKSSSGSRSSTCRSSSGSPRRTTTRPGCRSASSTWPSTARSVDCGWQDMCVHFLREHPPLARALPRERRLHQAPLPRRAPRASTPCRNGLRDIGVPIVVAGEHLATLFLASSSTPTSRRTEFFVRQAEELGFDELAYSSPPRSSASVLDRRAVENTVVRPRARPVHRRARWRALRHARDQKALRESEERFRMLADNMAQLADRRRARPHALVQQAVVRLHRLPPTDPYGTESSFVHPDHRERVVAKIRRRFETGRAGGHVPDQGEGRLLSLVPAALAPDPRRRREGHPLVRDHRRHGAAPGGGGGQARWIAARTSS